MKRYVHLSLAGLLLFAACQNRTDKKPTVEEVMKAAAATPGANAGAGKFDISTPAGWQRIDTALSGMKMTAILSPDTSRHFRANVNVVTASTNGLSLEKYFDANVDGIRNSLSQFNLIEKGEKMFGGLPGRWLHFTGQNADAIQLEQKMYVITNGGIAYIITCTSVKGQLAKDETSFDPILTSFKVH
jgi:hypothetical protein